ncbi:hypothetical protein HDU83_001232 [Entophlyctis luteolus]|nr:hypothetical protein HDU82_000741 [Entophlyctis luteolus]KAJ3348550.1 hypothetical protein HDU83_001232 [Entophlyctis luteolus]KAJ3388455.1 hypothetical protein HDU84_009729 [Entophlyctis sp. JEL0112]
MSEYNSDGSIDYTNSYFGVQPNKSLAIMAGVVFAALAVIQAIQAIHYKTKYMAALVIGVLLEASGYGLRVSSIGSPFDLGLFATQQGLIVISPVLIAATQYVMVEKIMDFVGSSASPLRPSIIAKTFVTTDIISFLVQGSGSGVLVSSPSSYTTGSNILIGGLVLQVICYVVFLTVSAVFYYRAKSAAMRVGHAWKTLFAALMASCLLILVRSVFRVVEFSVGYDGPIVRNEAYMYVFDFALIVAAVLVLAVYHPGSFNLNAEKVSDSRLT